MIFVQRIFDTGTGGFVYYSEGTINTAPTVTAPPFTGTLVVDSHAILQIIGEGFLSVQDNGSPVSSETTTVDFTGAVVTTTNDGHDVHVNISAGGSIVTDSSPGVVPQLSGVQYAVLMEDPIGTPVWALLTGDAVGPSFEIASFSKNAPGGGTLVYRRGDAISGITSAATYNSGPPDSAGIVNVFGGSTDGGDGDPGVWTINSPFASGTLAGSVTRNGSDLGADPTMTATITADKGASSKQANFVISWTRDVYYGVDAAGLSTEGDIEGLASSVLSGSRARTIVMSPANEKVYYSYPKPYGTATFTLSGFPFDMQAPSEVSVTNTNGVTSTYYSYESTNLLTGTNLNIVVT